MVIDTVYTVAALERFSGNSIALQIPLTNRQ